MNLEEEYAMAIKGLEDVRQKVLKVIKENYISIHDGALNRVCENGEIDLTKDTQLHYRLVELRRLGVKF